MLFNSLTFLEFFVLFFFLYWLIFSRQLMAQNLLILVGSYIFYAWWDWRFLFLLIGSSALNYFLGIWIYKSNSEKFRSILLTLGLVQGLGGLVFFKYFNFIIQSLADGLLLFHISPPVHTLNIVLPLGISFYTFKTISYLLDIKKAKIQPTTDWVVFFSYIAFFPCVISGPIDRPKTLIPQLEKIRTFDYAMAKDGLRQVLWGLFKKVVIADNCAIFTNNTFDHYKLQSASTLLFSAFLYTIQIYADFSGYSDMAIGIAKLLGIQVTRNFDFPFFAQNIADFWRRWHISLTTWLTDYVFTPLSIYFRDYGQFGLILAIVINFTAIGIWHGANWTFILFGFLHGCYYVPLIIRGTINKKKKLANNLTVSFGEFVNIIATFLLVMFTFVIFRSDSISQAIDYYSRLFSLSIFSNPIQTEKLATLITVIFILIMLIAEWIQKDKQHALQIDNVKKFSYRILIYYSVLFSVLVFGASKSGDFIYFKF